MRHRVPAKKGTHLVLLDPLLCNYSQPDVVPIALVLDRHRLARGQVVVVVVVVDAVIVVAVVVVVAVDFVVVVVDVTPLELLLKRVEGVRGEDAVVLVALGSFSGGFLTLALP